MCERCGIRLSHQTFAMGENTWHVQLLDVSPCVDPSPELVLPLLNAGMLEICGVRV